MDQFKVERRVYHVVRREDESWQVIRDGFHRPHVVSGSKAAAILMAKRLAKGSPNAQVIVHGLGNSIERQFTFRLDEP
jgi:hypothetical protein